MTKDETIYTHVKYAVSSIIFLQISVFLLTKCRGKLLVTNFSLADFHLVPAASRFAAAIFASIFFSVKGAPIRDTCQTNLIEEGFEGFSTVRYSYLAESTGSRQDQVDPRLCHGEKLRFEEK